MSLPAPPAVGFPGTAPLLDNSVGRLTPVWLRFLLTLFNRTGGASGQVYLDAAGTISVQYDGTSFVFLNKQVRVASLNASTGALTTKGPVTPSGTP